MAAPMRVGNLLQRSILSGNLCDLHVRWMARKPGKIKGIHPETPRRMKMYDPPEEHKGEINYKAPMKVKLEAGKLYYWCTCGRSHNQPFCDGTHKRSVYRETKFTTHTYHYAPMRFTVDETKEYWLCFCKQTNNRPFCDGSHRSEKVQNALQYIF